MSSKKNEDNYFRPPQLDADLERELAEALGDQSLSDIMDAEDKAQQSSQPPDLPKGVRIGKVISVQGEDIFVDLGGRSEGILPATQFGDDPLPTVGEDVEVTIEGYDNRDGLLLLSRRGAVLAVAWNTIEVGQTVEGRVTGHNKGGLELDIQGIKAFMPISQIERFRVDSIEGYVNQRLRCEVTEVDRASDNVIVSRRDLLEVEAAEAAEKLKESLAEGKIVKGVVRSIMPYGAFIDLGGVDGLLHVSDMSYSRVEDPAEIVKIGQQVEVMVLKIDAEKDRISLGLKHVMPDPWDGAEGKWPVDSTVAGRVTRLADFGAFVELAEGVEGLVPMSELSFERRVNQVSEIVNVGDVVRVRVLNVDMDRHRIGLSLKRVGDDPWTGASVRWPVGSIIEGTVTRIEEFGAFVQFTAGVEGLVHISELSDSRVRSVEEVVQQGQTVGVKVLEVDEQRRRMSLSIKQVTASPDYTGPASDEPQQPQPQRKRKKPLRGGLD